MHYILIHCILIHYMLIHCMLIHYLISQLRIHAIRMVWIISRHYNTDERMVPLVELLIDC